MVYINYDNAGINLKNGKVIATEKLDMAGVAMLYDNGTFTMEKVEMSIPGDSWGIGTNGSKVNNTILLKDSTLNVVDGLGIYFPGSGSVTIDNSVINAKHFGVQVCAGDLVITGANTSIVATGTAQPKTDGDGRSWTAPPCPSSSVTGTKIWAAFPSKAARSSPTHPPKP